MRKAIYHLGPKKPEPRKFFQTFPALQFVATSESAAVVEAGAGLEVACEEPVPATRALWTLDNVLVTPHVGGAGSDQLQQLLDMIAENIRLYLDDRPLLRRVSG